MSNEPLDEFSNEQLFATQDLFRGMATSLKKRIEDEMASRKGSRIPKYVQRWIDQMNNYTLVSAKIEMELNKKL